MEKIEFDHSAKQVFKALGISEDRCDELSDTIDHVVGVERVSPYSKVVERIIELFKPKNAAEFIWLGACIEMKTTDHE